MDEKKLEIVYIINKLMPQIRKQANKVNQIKMKMVELTTNFTEV